MMGFKKIFFGTTWQFYCLHVGTGRALAAVVWGVATVLSEEGGSEVACEEDIKKKKRKNMRSSSMYYLKSVDK